MVESSRPWNGELLGDSGPYTADQWDNVWGRLFGSEAGIYADDGVIRNFANELAPTVGGANDCHVDTGAALVHGKFYRSDTLIHVNVPSATAGHWREDLICPQTNWAAQVIRVLRHANPNEDVVYPAPTQVDGTTWEIPICAARVTDAGVVTVADLRQFASDLMRPKKLFIPPAAYLPANTSWRYIGGHVAIRKEAFGAGELARFEFRIPPDFHEVVSAAVIFVNFGTNRADWTFYSSGAASQAPI